MALSPSKLEPTMNLEGFQYPVGALSFLTLNDRYLLAGEGNQLEIFHYESARSIAKILVFAAQAIHGTTCCEIGERHSRLSSKVLLWGGRSISVLEISQSDERSAECSIKILISELKVDDWIVDGLLTLQHLSQRDTSNGAAIAICVTSKNELLHLSVQDGNDVLTDLEPILHTLASGPRSTLCSANVTPAGRARFVIASGTVTGEIVVWSATLEDTEQRPVRSCLHYELVGHEGSIFGVKLSANLSSSGGSEHLLASCSDDRSIRLWDVSSAFTTKSATQNADVCVGKVIGHASRIWSIHFLYRQDASPSLLSLGEDGTAQLWRLSTASARRTQAGGDGQHWTEISHISTYEYHSGKHLWGIASKSKSDGSWTVATGAADGRIVTYSIDPDSSEAPSIIRSSWSHVAETVNSLEANNVRDANDEQAFTERTFRALFGEWQLSRVINSSMPNQPAGHLEGKANIDKRSVTDDTYDFECLYTEEGDFTSDLGFTLKARRQYVYRYQKAKDEISVWFVKSDGKTVDYLFHVLYFKEDVSQLVASREGAPQLIAEGYHLCEKDVYEPKYSFEFEDSGLHSWQIDYTVKGPQKDYVSRAKYARDRLLEISEPPKTEPKSHVVSGDKSKSFVSEVDSLKAYAWLSKSEFLTTTEQGKVLIGALRKDRLESVSTAETSEALQWKEVGQMAGLKSTSILSSVPSAGLVFLTGNQGTVYVYQHATVKMSLLLQCSRKLGFLKAQQPGNNYPGDIISEEAASITFSYRELGKSQCISVYVYPEHPPRIHTPCAQQTELKSTNLESEFVTTSSYVLADVTLEGSRYGELRVFDRSLKVKRVFPQVHGQDAITVILPLQTWTLSKHTLYFLTAGRDGRVAYHRLEFDLTSDIRIRFETIHTSSPAPCLSIEGAYHQTKNRHLILWGFSSTQFMVWNETTRQAIMTTQCGGSHRKWSYLPHDDTGGGSFVYTKASACYTFYHAAPSHRVLQYGGHGREIKAVAVQPIVIDATGEGHPRSVATGAEDTTIRLFNYKNDAFSCEVVLTGHNSGLQQLQWSSDGRFLFSAGGCEELIAWRIRMLDDMPCVVRDAQCPTVTKDRALRVMDFTISNIDSPDDQPNSGQDCVIKVVYSDSSIRTWRFIASSAHVPTAFPRFVLLHTTTYSSCCLTQIQSLNHFSSNITCTAGSDGRLAFWKSEKGATSTLGSLGQHAVHQSSVHAILSIPSTSSIAQQAKHTSSSTTGKAASPVPASPPSSSAQVDYLLITGGDDQAIGLTRLSLPTPNAQHLQLSTFLIPNAHASAVTALAYLGFSQRTNTHRFASIGTDQRLKIWCVSLDQTEEGVEGLVVKKERDVYTGVADASSMEAWRSGDGRCRLVVVGIGMESWVLDSI